MNDNKISWPVACLGMVTVLALAFCCSTYIKTVGSIDKARVILEGKKDD